MLQNKPLITVKALSTKMAKQISIAYLNEGVGRKILEAFKSDTCRPIAWANGEVLDGIPDMSKAWLVEFEGTLYWMVAPYCGKCDETSVEWMKVCCKDLPQVFIG